MTILTDEQLSKTKTQKWIGVILFFIGSVIAISSGAKLPAEGMTFPNTLPNFLGGVVAAIMGLVLWHWREKQFVKHQIMTDHQKDGNNPTALLKGLIESLEVMKTKINDLDCNDVCKEVDKVLDQYVMPLAEARHGLILMYGMAKGADILLTIAYGERLLNRMWSAASDNHVQEARSCFPEAYNAFQDAWKEVQKGE